MTPDIHLRESNITDATRFYEMVSSPKYVYFGWGIFSVDDAYNYLLAQQQRNEQGRKTEDMYSIILDGEIIGAVWVIRLLHRRHVGEVGYFVDEKYWGKGIATKAVKMIEKIAFEELGFLRLTIVLKPANEASERVAIKSGYTKEGVLKSEIRNPDGTLYDGLLYAKLKTEYETRSL